MIGRRLPSLLVAGLLAVFTVPGFAGDTTAPKGDDKKDDKKDDRKGDAKSPEAPTVAKEPVTCVLLAKSWDAALKDAKAQNVPIVLHNHGFYCPPCWGMHQTVMCDATYMAFALENTVEVLALDRLQEGVTKKEERAATYDAKEAGRPTKYLVEFPGLTVDQVLALRNSKASTYNKSGGLPYTALIDPYTEEEIKSWKGGGIAPGDIMAAVTEARTSLQKAHGKGKPKAEVKALVELETVGGDRVKAGDFAAALDACAAATKKADKDGWPPVLRERLAKVREAAVAAATAAVDAIERTKAEDAAKAKKDLAALTPKLRGTGLEPRAKDLAAGL